MVTGADGMLGEDLVRRLRKGPHRVIATTINSMDVTDLASVKHHILKSRPDVIVHTAAYTAVDKAESERELCMAVNGEGTKNVAFFCRELGAEMIYISTDYVFDGSKKEPYVETDSPHPINVYGRSKLIGERMVETLVPKHKICRTSWLLGLHGITGANFLEAIFRVVKKRKTLRVVSDQVGRPTFTFDLAALIERLVSIPEWGIFHTTNAGRATWHDLALEALRMRGFGKVRLIPISSSEYHCDARRPLNSLLDSPRLERLGIAPLPHWRDGLREYLSRRKRTRRKD